MKNYYSTVDNVVMTFSDIEERNGFDEITVYFERANDKGEFDFAEGKYPNKLIYKSYGFSQTEIMSLWFGKSQEKRQVIELPSALLDFMGYKIYFWSRENDEPIHVHVSKGTQIENGTKFWITRDSIELEHNKGKIPQNDLKKIQKYLWANREIIIARWYQFFGM